jgi:uncharacterized protein (TIGR03032 family)
MTEGYGQLEPQPRAEPSREVQYEHSSNLAETLARAGISIVISTYQAGKLVVIGSSDGRLELGFHNYDRPMGIAIDPHVNRLAVATRDAIWIANNDAAVARQLPKPGSVGTCFLTRAAHFTGDIQAHEIAWANGELWIVNTRFSCLCTLDARHSFVPRWRPRFVDALVAEDRCHLNGLAVEDWRPKYVTALAETNTEEGWRPVKQLAGCLIDVESHAVVLGGLSMPHSPVVHRQCVYLLNSGHGTLLRIDPSGAVDVVGRFPGFTRGLAVHRDLAVVGLSKIRETSTFGGLPISERASDLKCGIAVVNLMTRRLESQFEFKSGVDEIFDVAVVPRPGRVALRGPHATGDGHETIWAVPSRPESV